MRSKREKHCVRSKGGKDEMCANAFVDFSTAVASPVFGRNKKDRSDDLSRPSRRTEKKAWHKRRRGGATDPIFSSRRQRTQPHYITRTPPSFPPPWLLLCQSQKSGHKRRRKKKLICRPKMLLPPSSSSTHTKEKLCVLNEYNTTRHDRSSEGKERERRRTSDYFDINFLLSSSSGREGEMIKWFRLSSPFYTISFQ